MSHRLAFRRNPLWRLDFCRAVLLGSGMIRAGGRLVIHARRRSQIMLAAFSCAAMSWIGRNRWQGADGTSMNPHFAQKAAPWSSNPWSISAGARPGSRRCSRTARKKGMPQERGSNAAPAAILVRRKPGNEQCC